jgi:Tol biopolymer transport system component
LKVTTASNTASSAPATQTAAAAIAPVAPAAQVGAPTIGIVGFLNGIVTNLLNPFLAPAPNTPEPVTPAIWAVLAWVRRNFFNEAPIIAYDPTTTVQTGQTVTGNIGATDAEGDALTYTVTQGPQHGTLTVDQATGKFTYTPDDIDYDAAQLDSFTVSVADGKFNLLSLFSPHTDQEIIDLSVLSPTVQRVIVNLPGGFTNAAIPRFAADGKSLLFSATPPGAAAGARREVYQVNVDGTGLTCVTCGLADPTPLRAGTTAPRNLFKPVPFEDGSGRILFQSVDPANGAYTHVVYESDANGTRLVRILTPAGKPGVIATDPQREMRISPDGSHVLFSQIQLVPNPSDPPGFITAVPVVGTLTAGVDASGNKVYNITDARVVYPLGEGKQWTHDGKGVIILGGLYESGNVDDVVVDIATGQVTRLTGNLDYDEDVDLSPNNQWLVIDSTRGMDALTPVTRIVRPAFLPLLIQGSVYTIYAGTSDATNISNQPWLVAVEDDLKGENGIPLFVSDDPNTPADEGDSYTARSMPSWNADGTAVAFWEADTTDPTGRTSRLVVANLKYTTSVGTAADKSTPAMSSTFPTLSTNTPKQVQLPATGTYTGAGGGTALVAETTDATTGHIIRTVQYTNYVNGEGMILNGTESTDQSAAQNTIHYIANITVTGTHAGSLTGDAMINKLTRTITPTTAGSQIQSTLDGDTLVLLDPARVAADRAGV